ncbi:cell wall anchor protein [Myxococcus sp. CA033]|uniref:cell wall anchor protein n=1 Tax=Myxococcus sp. CA033 TaxID=2741516 RepID=UPI0020C614A6|nr:cell wall anchor protein [Myxococcus sp. CA033]
MTLKVFSQGVSRWFVSVSVLTLGACGPLESESAPSSSEEAPASVGAARQAVSSVSHRASTTAWGKTVTSLTLTKPAGTVAGDVLLVRLSNRNNVAAVATAPAGWTFLRSDQSASQIKAWVFYKVAGASEPASYAFTFDAAYYVAGSISAFSGANPTNPIDAQSGQKNGNLATMDSPAITTTSANGLAVWFGSQLWAGATCPVDPLTPPTGFTEAFEACLQSSDRGILFDMAWKELGAAGVQPAFNGVSTLPNTNIAQVVALRAADAPTCTVGDTFATTWTLMGNVSAPLIVEPSGLAASRVTPGAIYVHNEDVNDIVAISTTTAATLGSFKVAGVTPQDWEDVATGPCPTGFCIYMGDIGRSSASLPIPPNTFYVYRIPEPNIGAGQTSGDLTAQQFPFVYPDGGKDAEAIMVHPVTADIYIITKSGSGLSKVYKMPNPLPAPGVQSTLIFVSNLQLPVVPDQPNWSYTTSAAIHPCSNRFILRTYKTVYEFRAAPGAAFETAFAAAPVTLTDTVEGQGEAIEYDPSGASYYTMSESPSPFKLKRVLRQ